MKCDACNSAEASIFLTQIVNGKVNKLNLCPACAKAKGLDDIESLPISDNLFQLAGQSSPFLPSSALKCPVCGFTQNELKKTGRLGCSHCYTVFADTLSGMLSGMHKGTTHRGKVPARLASRREKQALIKSLRQQLSDAVSQENYELAASLRDQIHILEAELQPQPPLTLPAPPPTPTASTP